MSKNRGKENTQRSGHSGNSLGLSYSLLHLYRERERSDEMDEIVLGDRLSLFFHVSLVWRGFCVFCNTLFLALSAYQA